MTNRVISRRELFRRSGVLGGVLALPSLVPRALAAASARVRTAAARVAELWAGPEIYQSIGVRPLVNARGTFTILSGSLMLPEVRGAMDAAARHYVQLDELADAIGARLAGLTGAEWGLVTSGCAAALTHATAACVAGGNPDLHVRIPHLTGFPRDEVIIPKHSRNVYDAAVRAVGVRVIEGRDAGRARRGSGPAHGDDLRVRRSEGGRERAEPAGDRAAGPGETRPDSRRCRGRDPDDSERAPATRRHARGLQRREMFARTAGGGPAARP